MPYNYQMERYKVFTEDGVDTLFRVRDAVKHCIKECGAFREQELFKHIKGSYDSWTVTACLDYLIELGELVRWERKSWGQYSVYTTSKVHNA